MKCVCSESLVLFAASFSVCKQPVIISARAGQTRVMLVECFAMFQHSSELSYGKTSVAKSSSFTGKQNLTCHLVS